VKMVENITEIGQWFHRKQGNGKDQADGELKIIGRCINICWTQSVQRLLGKCHRHIGRPFFLSSFFFLSLQKNVWVVPLLGHTSDSFQIVSNLSSLYHLAVYTPRTLSSIAIHSAIEHSGNSLQTCCIAYFLFVYVHNFTCV
jgi:hypothetical protein